MEFLLQSFKENIDRPLAAILTLNTIAHTVGAIGVGAQATKIWAESDPLITGVMVPVLMTLAILILSETQTQNDRREFLERACPLYRNFPVDSYHKLCFR